MTYQPSWSPRWLTTLPYCQPIACAALRPPSVLTLRRTPMLAPTLTLRLKLMLKHTLAQRLALMLTVILAGPVSASVSGPAPFTPNPLPASSALPASFALPASTALAPPSALIAPDSLLAPDTPLAQRTQTMSSLAAESAGADFALFDTATVVDSGLLDATRGGFVTPTGLTVSLGVERLVLLNGDIVAHTRFQIADIGKLDEAQARQTSAALSSVNLVNNGPDNMNGASMAAALGGTIIQNSLNDQHIATRTIISSSVNSLGMLTTLNFQGSMSDALARAVLTQ